MDTSDVTSVNIKLVKVRSLELEYTAGMAPRYSSILVLSKDLLLVVDRMKYSLRLHNRHNGKFLAELHESAGPWGICVCGKNELQVAVPLFADKIEIVLVNSIGQTAVLKKARTLDITCGFEFYHGVKALKLARRLVVCGMKEEWHCWGLVSLEDGRVCTTQKICKYGGCSHLATNADDSMVFISCWTGLNSPHNGVYAYDISDFRQEFAYHHRDLTFPEGITVDRMGFIYVCNKTNPPCIHQITETGKTVKVHKEGMPRQPMAMYFDEKEGQMYVTNYGSKEVWILRPEHSDQDDLQDQDAFLMAIRNNDQQIEEMIRNQNIPKQNIMEVAMKQDRYSKGVQRALIEMSKLLRRAISDTVGVWCGYRPEAPHTPVFVVTLKDLKCTLKEEDIPQSFANYKIITRHKYVPNDEEINIIEEHGCKGVRSEDIARVNNCIAKHTESLMLGHSNLSIIRSCPIKARGYMKKKMEVQKDTCIVFYVPVKGIIPIGENEFPKDIDGIVTDVREGEFVLFGDHNAMAYHQKLRIGCCIESACKRGSLGGFVDLPDEKVGCLTAAHVVLEDITSYIQKGDLEKKQINYCLAQGETQIKMYQPKSFEDQNIFGNVHTIALEAGNIYTPSVDAAIIQITNDDRKPQTGHFPDCEYPGLTKEDPLLYTGGEILDDTKIPCKECRVIKFGCTTGLTDGYLTCSETCVRPVDVWGNYCYPVMFRQLEVSRSNFAAEGDSGALVFLCVGGNIHNLHAVGMVIGGNSTGTSCVVTPISAVFKKLGLTSNRFKVFPASQLSQLTERINTQIQAHAEQTETLNIHASQLSHLTECINAQTQAHAEQVEALSRQSETIDSIKQKINSIEENVTSLDRKIDRTMDSVKECFGSIMEVLKNKS